MSVCFYYYGKAAKKRLLIASLTVLFSSACVAVNARPEKREAGDTLLKRSLPSQEAAIKMVVKGIHDGVAEVGKPLSIEWVVENDSTVGGRFPFVVISTSPWVRLQGAGFMAIPPGALMPFGMLIDGTDMRIVFPLYLPPYPRSGQVRVYPLKADRMKIRVRYVLLQEDVRRKDTASGVQPATEEMEIEVQEFTPRIIVQDHATSARPDDVRLSYSGAYCLEIFQKRFRVLDASTGG